MEMGRALHGCRPESGESVCMKVCACVSWQGSGSGGAAEQGRATFMHLL